MPSRRHQIRIATCLALFALGTAPAGAQEPGAPAPNSGGAGRPTAELVDCHVAVDQSARYATFAGQMATLPGADRLAMRVDLQQRALGAGSAYHDVSAPNLGVWRRSASGVGALRYVKQVTDLPAPGAFRAVIRFRWLDSSGQVIHRAARRSTECVQPDERPRLRVAAIDAGPAPDGQPNRASYWVTIRNDGRGPAGSFGVLLDVDGQTQPALTVAALPAGGRTTLQAVAPRCSISGRVTVTLDPQHQISEAGGGGQPRSVPCPAAAQASARSGRR